LLTLIQVGVEQSGFSHATRRKNDGEAFEPLEAVRDPLHPPKIAAAAKKPKRRGGMDKGIIFQVEKREFHVCVPAHAVLDENISELDVKHFMILRSTL
jgi:hypothetical protein